MEDFESSTKILFQSGRFRCDTENSVYSRQLGQLQIWPLYTRDSDSLSSIYRDVHSMRGMKQKSSSLPFYGENWQLRGKQISCHCRGKNFFEKYASAQFLRLCRRKKQ